MNRLPSVWEKLLVSVFGRWKWDAPPWLSWMGARGASGPTSHGGFDDDAATLAATLARILNTAAAPPDVKFAHHRSQAALREQRAALTVSRT